METMIESRKMRSCMWIVNILQKHGRLTLAQLREFWQDDVDISRGMPLPRRTFFDYRNAIQDMLGIVVDCDKPTNTYYLNEGVGRDLSKWLISSFNVSQLVRENEEVRDRILLESPPSGMEHFQSIVEALRRQCCMLVTYQKFDDSDPYECHLQPYCLKLHQQRWYLLAVKDHGTRAVTFALDRIKHIDLMHSEKSPLPDGFTAQDYYGNCYGVWTGEGEVPAVRLRAYGNECKYLRSLPLHPSQREVLTCDAYADFELHCYTTRELLLHLLSHGSGLEVLEPKDFREAVEKEVREMMGKYEKS